MEAAKVLRGECSIDDIKVDEGKPGDYYGKPIVRPAALAKVCGVCDYSGDIELKMPANTLHAVFVQPKVAHHAKILKINTEEAEKMPGVYKVVTHGTSGSNRLNMWQFSPRTLATEQSHVLLQEDKIHNYGDVVAMVVADTKIMPEKRPKVTIDFEQLPESLNYLEAVMPDAVRIHDDHPNMWGMQPLVKGAGHDCNKIFDEAPMWWKSFYSQREPHMPIEGDTVQAYWSEEGQLTVHCKAMAIGGNVGDIAEGDRTGCRAGSCGTEPHRGHLRLGYCGSHLLPGGYRLSGV